MLGGRLHVTLARHPKRPPTPNLRLGVGVGRRVQSVGSGEFGGSEGSARRPPSPDEGPSSARRGAQEEPEEHGTSQEEPPCKGEEALQLAQGGGERDGRERETTGYEPAAEEEDTTRHISVFVGNLGDVIDE